MNIDTLLNSRITKSKTLPAKFGLSSTIIRKQQATSFKPLHHNWSTDYRTWKFNPSYRKNDPLSILMKSGSLERCLRSTWHPHRMTGTPGQSCCISRNQWLMTFLSERGWTTEKQSKTTSALKRNNSKHMR